MDAQAHRHMALTLMQKVAEVPGSIGPSATLAAAQVHATLALVQLLSSGLPVVFSDDVRQSLATIADKLDKRPVEIHEPWARS